MAKFFFKTLAQLLVAIFLVLPSIPAGADMTKVLILKEIVEVLGAAGDSIAKVTDGIKHMIITGASGYDSVKARNTLSRLRDISARTSDLMTVQRIRVLNPIEEYLSHPDPSRWPGVTDGLDEVLIKVKDVLGDVKKERSDFVLEAEYERMLVALSGRENILQKLMQIEPPTSPEELSILREVHMEYERLVHNLREAKFALNEYIKAQKNQ
jgi:hypothetical protein